MLLGLSFTFLLNSCQTEIKLKENFQYSDNEKSILDVEYKNDTLDLVIKDITITNQSLNEYEIRVIVETPMVEIYGQNHKFFIHCYKGDSIGDFMAIGTNTIKVEQRKIVYSRKFKSKTDSFPEMRYGLINKVKNKRYFNLAIDTVKFEISN